MKLNKKFVNRIMFLIMLCGFFFSFWLIITTTLEFGIHMHNIDLSLNILMMANDFNSAGDEYKLDFRQMEDTYAINQSDKYTNFYIMSYGKLWKVYQKALYAGMLFIWSLVGLITIKIE